MSHLINKGAPYGNDNAKGPHRKMSVKDWNTFDENTSYENWPRTSTGFPDSPPDYRTQEIIDKDAANGRYYSKQYKYVDEVTVPQPHSYYKAEPLLSHAELLALPKDTLVRAIQPNAKRGQGYKMKVGTLILRESDNTLSKEKHAKLTAQNDRLREAHWKVVGKPEPYKPMTVPTYPNEGDGPLSRLLKTLKSEPTHKPGGQFGNDNASKTHANAKIDFDTDSVEAELWHIDKVAEAEHNPNYAYVKDYSTSMNYYGVNKFLRSTVSFGSDDDKWRNMHKGMMKNLIPLDRDVQVYRGAKGKYVPEVGRSFYDSGFVSASLRKSKGLRFLYDQPNEVLARFTIPKGTPVIYANFMGEQEIILPPHHKFEITNRMQDSVFENEEGFQRKHPAHLVDMKIVNDE